MMMNRKAQARFPGGNVPPLSRRERGQAAIEFLVLISFFLVFAVPIVLVMFDLTGESADRVAMEQAHQAARDISEAADQVYIQGGNAEIRREIFFPSKMGNVFIGSPPPGGAGKEIILRVNTSSGPSDVVMLTVGTVKEPSSASKRLNSRLGAGLREIRVYNSAGAVVVEYAN